jgi:hypothetical protein
MKCREAMRLLLIETAETDAGLNEHLAGCAECRRFAELVSSLRRAGEGERANDLSPEAIRETQRAAAAILADRRERPGAFVFPAWWRPRAAVPAAAVLALLLAGVSVLWHRKGGEPQPAGRVEAAQLEAGIDTLLEGIRYDVAWFSERYLEGEPRFTPDGAQDLQAKIELCARRVMEELGCVSSGSFDAAPRPD